MAMATAMYHSGKNPLRKVTEDSEDVPVAKAGSVRKLHKAFIRYHDPANWPMLREALKRMGREDLIGPGKKQLVPAFQPAVLGTIRQSDGTTFKPNKPLPKAFNNMKNAARPNQARATQPTKAGMKVPAGSKSQRPAGKNRLNTTSHRTSHVSYGLSRANSLNSGENMFRFSNANNPFTLATFWLILFLALMPSLGQAADKGLFWKAESPSGITSYLFGTMHTDDNRVTEFSPQVMDALNSVNTFMMEVSPGQDPKLLMLKEGNIATLMTNEEFEQVRELADFHVMHLGAAMQMKPWLLAVIFDLPKPQTPFAQDNLLMTKAEELLKDVESPTAHREAETAKAHRG